LERRWKGPDRIFVVPCGTDPEYCVPGDRNRRRGLLYVGSWLDRKGVRYLAEAYQLVHEQGCPIPLSIVGYGQTTDEVLRSFEPALRPKIRIGEHLRILDERSLIEEYRTHELFAFPSLYEGFGMVLLEAMASGLAVIATPVGGVVDLVRHEENGVIVPLRDSRALAQAIVDLWRSPEKRRLLGEAARITGRLYLWDKIAERTLQCYRAVGERTRQV
jgi:glycosyltransferase involved in cell wall biosynthesis